LDELRKVETLIRRKRWAEAVEMLESLNHRYANRPEVLSALANTHYELGDMQRYQAVCERLLKTTPGDADLTLALARAYVKNMWPALALRTYRRFLDRWPDHSQADEARTMVAELKARMDDILVDLGLDVEGGLELATWHEEAQSLLAQGEYRQAHRVEQQLLRRHPGFAPALNNISQIDFLQGRREGAIGVARQVLAFDPDNFHALSNLARYLCLNGRVDEAQTWAERLKAVESDQVDVWVKKAEALSYLGDDEGVLDAFAGAERAGHLDLVDPILYHLAAVAAMRLGREDEARRHWQRARELSPGLELVQDNLDDLRKPVAERHAPWVSAFPNWASERIVRDLLQEIEPASRRGEEAASQAARRYLRRHPEIVGLVPQLLDRGDPQGREFALRIALMTRTPEMLDALRDFALSRRGPDAMRMLAAHAASEGRVLPSGLARLWMRGEWREILLLGFELHDEDDGFEHRPQVDRLLVKATTALQQREGRRAEQLLLQALEAEPDAPDLLNNLAAAYGLQGRRQEAESLVRQVHERHPDYVFARTSVARIFVDRGEIDQAKALLEPLFSRKRLHYGELGALCEAQIELYLAQDDFDGARSWLDMWADADPEEPAVERWRARLGRVKPRPQRSSGPRLNPLRRFLGQRAVRVKKPQAAGYRKGDVVRVRPGTVCPDAPELDIGGWQGRIVDLTLSDHESEPVIGFAWDSVSLQAMPMWFIEDSKVEGLGWSRMYLSPDEVELGEPRDTERDATRARRRIEKRFKWVGVGPEGVYIQQVVNSAKGSSERAVIRAWGKHLKQSLRFPFQAEVDESQERGPLQAGDRLTVLEIKDVDEFYGVTVSCRQGRQHFDFPLADLAAVDEDSSNAEPIQAYRVWFANR